MCMAAGIDPPEEIFVHGYLLMGGQKLGKTMIQSGVVGRGPTPRTLKITDVSPLALADEFGVDPLRYHLLRDVPLGGDGDFSYEGIVARYNADLANNLGNLVSRVATVVHSKCGGIGPGPDPDSTLVGPRRRGAGAARPPPGPAGPPTRPWRRPGGSSGRPTPSWRPPSPGRWIRARGRRRPRQRPRGAADRGHPDLAPAMPARRRRSGDGSGWRATPRRRPAPRRRGLGRLPGGVAVVKGDPLFPRRKV
jgi:methionyl-tRNA synthetase